MEARNWKAIVMDPARIGSSEGKELDELARLREEYPYCQLLHLLYCEGLKRSGDLEWKEVLYQAALHVPDRLSLYRSLQEGTIDLQDEGEEEDRKTGAEAQQEVQPSEEEGSSAVPEDPETSEAEGPDPAPMKKEILSEAVRQGMLYDPEKMLADEGAEEDQGEESERPSSERGTREVDEPEREWTGRMSFSDWLEGGRSGRQGSSSAPRKSEEGIELIERFIEEGRERIHFRPDKEEFFSSERMARKGSEEDDLPVSETLAELYAQQGELKRAVAAFERLRLKVPEKSDYFARRIKELKERL